MGCPSYLPIVRLKSSDVNLGDLAPIGSEIDANWIEKRISYERLPGNWNRKSLSVAGKHHVRTHTSRICSRSIISREDRRFKPDRFYEKQRDGMIQSLVAIRDVNDTRARKLLIDNGVSGERKNKNKLS